MGTILDFYNGKITNHYKLSFDDMLQMSDVSIENSHTCIQWLFPLQEMSMATPNSPLITDEEIEAFKNVENKSLRQNLIRATRRMLSFYGLEIKAMPSGLSSKPVLGIVKAPGWEQKFENWVTVRNHNFKRLTRMVRSLSLLGLDPLAIALQDCLLLIAMEEDDVDVITRKYWEEARIFPKVGSQNVTEVLESNDGSPGNAG